jgi:hypothetical protein
MQRGEEKHAQSASIPLKFASLQVLQYIPKIIA